MSASRFITLCLHTSAQVVPVKELLEAHGITVASEKFRELPGVGNVYKVMVCEDQVQVALRVLESGTHEAAGVLERKIEGVSDILLIPVDFSESTFLACRIGFSLAGRLSLTPVLLHAYSAPYFYDAPFSADIADDDPGVEISEVEASHDLSVIASRQMHDLKSHIASGVEAGLLPDISYKTVISEGLPEDVILQFTRDTPPVLVVMATRGRDRKHTASFGSVTAEVIDRCRVPLFTVPDNIDFKDVESITRLAFMCTMTRNDIDSVETLMRMFSYPSVEMWLLAADVSRQPKESGANLKAFASYLKKNYPASSFHCVAPSSDDVREITGTLVKKDDIQLIIVPNRKTNLFHRIFKPGVAHKIFFEGDVPLLVLPV